MEKKNTGIIAFGLIVGTLILLGLLSVYSASYPQALDFGYSSSYFFVRQAVFAVAALAACVVIYFIPLKAFKLLTYPLLLVCLVLMLLTLFTRFGQTSLGARRWLSLGPLPSFQPSELVKFSSILFLSKVLTSPVRDQREKTRRQLLSAAVCLVFALLILMQKDYSTTVIYLGVCISLLLLSKVSLPWLGLGFLFLLTGGLAVMLSEPYRVKRIVAFLFPNIDPSGINYQVSIARKAIESGGIFGKGLGLGYYKHGILPEVQNDFILSCIAEEGGLLTILLVFGLFLAFALLGYKASRKTAENDPFASYLAFGFTTMIFWQALVNAAVVSGLFPPTGIPLPFFSQGGTNLFVVICEAGFLFKIIAGSEKEDVVAQRVRIDSNEVIFPVSHE